MLAAGTTLGPYRILGPLGAGGMGEVYRARDTRLGRDVAVKVIPAELAGDPERLKRFEQEALAAGALNHPNVCILHDVGSHEGAPYVVMELLEGESLRDRLTTGPLPPRKALDVAAQVAHGLAAAHARGIVHRDLKPENLFLTKDGRAKVLDFGLAKLARPEDLAASGERTNLVSATETGAILGTAGYMSPEQVLGKPADARSDLFALGAVLYEMLAGKRAFSGPSYVETLNAILHEDPPPLTGSGRQVPPALEPIVRRCVEKSPAERFQSASDLAFALEGLISSSASVHGLTAPAGSPSSFHRRAALLVLGLAFAATAVGGAYFVGHRGAKHLVPSYQRVTFRRGGLVFGSRFTPDGQSVVYATKYVGEKPDIYVRRLTLTDARPLGLPGAVVVGISGGEIAILRGDTLSRIPIEGGTPRDIAEGVWAADWSVDGSKFAVVRSVNDAPRLECPIGRALIETTGGAQIYNPRLSPRADKVAYVWRFQAGNYSGQVEVVDLSGRRRVLAKGLADFGGVSWSPDGREVWFTGTRKGATLALYAVTLAGKERLVLRTPTSLALHDIASDGRVLLMQYQQRWETRGLMAGDSAERDLTWLDGTLSPLLTPDGRQMLFNEWGEGGGERMSTYMRRTDGRPPVRLGDGAPLGQSRDGKWVLAEAGPPWQRELRMIPTGAGEAYPVPGGPVAEVRGGFLSPDGKLVVRFGAETGKPEQSWVQELPSGLPRPLGPPGGLAVGTRGSVGCTPDGRWWPSRPPGARAPSMLYPVDGGAPRAIPWLQIDDEPFQWSDDSRYLFVTTPTKRPPVVVTRIDMRTGERRPWLRLAPPDMAGVEGGGTFISTLTPDGRYYGYYYQRNLADLYVATGLK